MPATPTAAHRGSSAAAAAAAAAHAVDDSYYAGSPDSATGDTGSASDREDGIDISGRRRQLSPDVGCAEDGVASLDRFRRCELLRGRWIPFDKTYLERLFDSALTEMNREIFENERLTSMTSTACASSTASKTGRRQSSSSRASRPAKSALDQKDNKYVGSYNGKACSPYVFGRREATRNDVRSHQKAQKELRQTAAISPADVGSSNQAASKSSKRKNAEILRIDVEDDCTSESMESSTAESSTSVQMSSERPSARRDSDLPIVGPANNQWVIIEKNALLRCFEEALASEVRQARAGRAVPNDNAAAQQRADKRRWKQHHRPGGARANGSTTSVKEPPPRPSSAPILLQSASPSISSSDVECDEAVCTNRDKVPLMSKFGPLPTSAGGKYDASMSNCPSLNDNSQQQFTGRFPSVFPPPPSQQMPLPFQQLFASYPFPAPPPFAAAAAAAFSPEAAAAATAAFLNTMRHQLAAGTGGAGTGSGAGGALYHPDALPFMLSSFLFQQAPLFAGASSANSQTNTIRSMLDHTTRRTSDMDSVDGSRRDSAPFFPEWNLPYATHNDINNSDEATLPKRGSSKRKADVIEGSDGDQRKQRMDDCDGWVAVSKSRVHQVISDLLEHEDTPSHQQTSSSVMATSPKLRSLSTQAMPPFSDVVDGVNRLDVSSTDQQSKKNRKKTKKQRLSNVVSPSTTSSKQHMDVVQPLSASSKESYRCEPTVRGTAIDDNEDDGYDACGSGSGGGGECLKWKSRLLRRCGDDGVGDELLPVRSRKAGCLASVWERQNESDDTKSSSKKQQQPSLRSRKR